MSKQTRTLAEALAQDVTPEAIIARLNRQDAEIEALQAKLAETRAACRDAVALIREIHELHLPKGKPRRKAKAKPDHPQDGKVDRTLSARRRERAASAKT